jgi:hypothetical protein
MTSTFPMVVDLRLESEINPGGSVSAIRFDAVGNVVDY